MKKGFTAAIIFVLLQLSTHAQDKGNNDTTFKPSGKFWGYTFLDYYYKAHADSLNRGGRQYTGVEQGRNAFQVRRSYLGFNYNIHPSFSAEVLLAAEDNITNSSGVTSGDLTLDNKLTFFIKNANLRWKNIFKGSDMVVGIQNTPAFAKIVDPVWGYRSIERSLADFHRTPSYDLGIGMEGKYPVGNTTIGYDFLASNGTSARPENDKYKMLSGDVYAKLLDNKLVLQLYADYQRYNWTSHFHHSTNMIKAFAGYTTPAFSAGVEGFIINKNNDIVGVQGNVHDTLNGKAAALSVFMRGSLVKDKLGFFARTDMYNPYTNYNGSKYQQYKGLLPEGEPATVENFITAGLDFTPIANVHFMPNIWYNHYHSRTAGIHDSYDMVYKMTFYFVYGR